MIFRFQRPQSPRLVVGSILFAFFIGCLAGCGGDPDLAPVSGKVSYQGKPVKKGVITFEPRDRRSARGKIVDGEILDVTTYTSGDGAYIGAHRIFIHAWQWEPKGMEIPPMTIPERYGNPETSGLTRTIVAGQTNELTLELTD